MCASWVSDRHVRFGDDTRLLSWRIFKRAPTSGLSPLPAPALNEYDPVTAADQESHLLQLHNDAVLSSCALRAWPACLSWKYS